MTYVIIIHHLEDGLIDIRCHLMVNKTIFHITI